MCGIFGIEGQSDAANMAYLGLYALQHRGQESAGIVSWDGAQLHVERGMGEVSEIFRVGVLKRLAGDSAIGHTRYSTAGSSVIANAQPIVVKTSMGPD
jgi:amidophosphoribosyltransferase